MEGTGRWGFEWIPPTEPGTYLISVEITDDDGDVTFVPSNAEIVVLPRKVSLPPEINLISEYNGKSFTTKSNLRFTARARDQDGKLEACSIFRQWRAIGSKNLFQLFR